MELKRDGRKKVHNTDMGRNKCLNASKLPNEHLTNPNVELQINTKEKRKKKNPLSPKYKNPKNNKEKR